MVEKGGKDREFDILLIILRNKVISNIEISPITTNPTLNKNGYKKRTYKKCPTNLLP